jgi:glycosyltransferase involved in cell wall biosynthesis
MKATVFISSESNDFMNTLQKPKHLLLLSRGLARYRHTFTEHLAASLPSDVEVTACPIWGPLWEVDFPALKAQEGRVRYCDLPSHGTLVAQKNPSVVGIMEYPWLMLRELFAAKRRRLPVIVFSELGNGIPKQRDVKLTTRLMHRFFASFTDGQVALSPSAQVPFGAPWRPVCFAPHSIDTREFTARSWDSIPRKCTILCVAQYTPRKGQDLLAKALARAKAEHGIDFELRLVGILDEKWLDQVLRESGIREQSVILGVKQGDALLNEFRQADFFVLPSRFDTYGVVTQEAAACGLPLVISRFAGSSQNLVNDGQNGYVVDPHNTAEFSQRLADLIRNPSAWPAMGAHSRALAEHYCVRRLSHVVADWMLPWLS